MNNIHKIIHEAIDTKYRQRIRDKIADTPEGHINAFTNAVYETLKHLHITNMPPQTRDACDCDECRAGHA